MQSGIKTSTNIKIPLSFILFGLAAFVFAQWILFVESGELVSGQFRIPAVWMSAHLLILGFCVMIAMGAMYQLVPVAFLTPVWNQTFGFIQFFVTLPELLYFPFSSVSGQTSPFTAERLRLLVFSCLFSK